MNNFLSQSMNLTLLSAQAGDAGKVGQASAKLEAQMGRDADGKLDHTAKEFEAVFIAEMMKPMFEGISTEAPFGGGKGEEVFRGMMLQEYGKMISQTGSIGIADHVKDAMIRMQDDADGLASALNAIEPGATPAQRTPSDEEKDI